MEWDKEGSEGAWERLDSEAEWERLPEEAEPAGDIFLEVLLEPEPPDPEVPVRPFVVAVEVERVLLSTFLESG